MLIFTIVLFLFVGLYFFGVAVHRLWLIEWYQLNPTPIAVAQVEKEEDPGPRLTRLGRPIIEIKLSA